MILCLADILSIPEVEQIRAQLNSLEPFGEGKATAGWHARLVKDNLQVRSDWPGLKELRALVQAALQRHPVFPIAVWPKVISPILFSRYDVGMSYGTHVDNAVIGADPVLRSDVSMTLFLSDPVSYEGGELVIESPQGEDSFKLAAGSAIVYPSTTLHRVEPVRAGVRLAAVTWIQSLVRDPGDREILFDLDTVRQTLFAQHGKSHEFDLLSKCQANLLRQWAEL